MSCSSNRRIRAMLLNRSSVGSSAACIVWSFDYLFHKLTQDERKFIKWDFLSAQDERTKTMNSFTIVILVDRYHHRLPLFLSAMQTKKCFAFWSEYSIIFTFIWQWKSSFDWKSNVNEMIISCIIDKFQTISGHSLLNYTNAFQIRSTLWLLLPLNFTQCHHVSNMVNHEFGCSLGRVLTGVTGNTNGIDLLVWNLFVYFCRISKLVVLSRILCCASGQPNIGAICKKNVRPIKYSIIMLHHFN